MALRVMCFEGVISPCFVIKWEFRSIVCKGETKLRIVLEEVVGVRRYYEYNVPGTVLVFMYADYP